MNVYIPWTFLHPPTWDLLAPFEPIGVDVSGDDGAYLRYFVERWREREPFVNVEHDMLVHPAQIDQLIACPEPYCAYGYERPGQFPWFGVVRFRPEIMDRMPLVWDELQEWAECPPREWAWRLVGEVPVKGPPPGELANSQWVPLWQHLDQWFVSHAQQMGLICHRHWPNVQNTRSRPGYDLAPTAPH